MNILKPILVASSVFLLSISMAHAGNGTFKNSDGSKVKITCNGSGCFETFTNAAGKKGKKTKVGPGGRQNYLKHKKAWASKGYK